jgi:hypothetical protein
MEENGALSLAREHAVEHQSMHVNIEVEGRAEPLVGETARAARRETVPRLTRRSRNGAAICHHAVIFPV